jgi:hypothetical protein
MGKWYQRVENGIRKAMPRHGTVVRKFSSNGGQKCLNIRSNKRSCYRSPVPVVGIKIKAKQSGLANKMRAEQSDGTAGGCYESGIASCIRQQRS